MKNVVAIAGIETIRNDAGEVLRYADTFLNNVHTWIAENPAATVKVLDARHYTKCDNPVQAVWKDVVASFDKIDTLIYSGHSSPESLICFSHIRLDLTVEQRYFRIDFDYTTAPWSDDASFYIYGCQAGGEHGVVWPTSIAQCIANQIKRTVYAYTSKSYQKESPKGCFHQVSDDKIGLVKFIPNK